MQNRRLQGDTGIAAWFDIRVHIIECMSLVHP